MNEKDSQISGLLEEGEKLSKQQLTLNTTIKKLRARVKESEEKLKNLEEKNKKNEENLQKKTEEHNNLQVHLVISGQGPTGFGSWVPVSGKRLLILTVLDRGCAKS